jgi:hypothetical protein
MQMYGEHCDICHHYVPEHIKPVDDKDGKPMDVCGLCLQGLVDGGMVDDDGYLKFSKEELDMDKYDVKFKIIGVENLPTIIIPVEAMSPEHAETLGWQNRQIEALRDQGAKIKFASVRLIEGAA